MFSVLTIKQVKVKFGGLIKQSRKKANLSQEELGKLLNLSRITIQNVESGRNATMDTMLLLMRHFELMADFHDLLVQRMDENDIPSLY
jgi:transcriptional regulator with XRE-family HTH domain